MPSPRPDKASRREALRLVKRLAVLEEDWAAEPSLYPLPRYLISALQYEISEAEFSRSTLTWVGWIAYACVCGLTVSYRAAWVWPSVFIPMLIIGFMRSRNVRLQRYMVYALTRTDDVTVLPTLLKATQSPIGHDPAVIAAIHRLLEQITEAHIGLLNREAQDTLWSIAAAPLTLRRNADEAFAFRALQALGVIGDGDVLRAMKRIANNAAVYPSEHRLYAQVQALIPSMEARLQRQEAPQNLLRASQAADSNPDTLLRSHSAQVSLPSQQLLRASLSETQETD